MFRTILMLTLSLLLSVVSLNAATTPSPDVEVSHKNSASGPLPPVSIKNGATFYALIFDTDTDCFDYSLNGVIPSTGGSVNTFAFDGGTDKTRYPLTAQHRERITQYRIQAKRKANAGTSCNALAERDWTVDVLGFWNVAVAGAITFDGLTNEIFFLEPGKGKLPNSTTEQDGFYVRSNSSAEDQFQLGLGAGIHFFYDSGRKVDWVPFSLTLETVGNNQLKVLVSPALGLRLGDRAFLTAGIAAGQRNRLPNNLRVGDFVATDTALGTTALTRQAFSWYFGVSIAMFQADLSSFRRRFAGGTGQ